MKNLLKLLVLVIAFAMTTQSYAQLRVKAGLNLSNMVVADDDDSYDDDLESNPGFHVGVTTEVPLSDLFSFETGLILSTKGYKTSDEGSILGIDYKSESNLNLLYVDIPLTAKVKAEVGGANIYGVFGPYVGVGLSGKGTSETTVLGDTETDENDVEWGSDENDDDFKRLDFGLLVGAGVEIKSVQVGLTYGLGLANVSPYSDNGYSANHRVLGVSLGYKIGGND